MKKAIILGAIAAVLALSITLGIKTWKTNESTLLMANLEALTNPEETNPYPEKETGKTREKKEETNFPKDGKRDEKWIKLG